MITKTTTATLFRKATPGFRMSLIIVVSIYYFLVFSHHCLSFSPSLYHHHNSHSVLPCRVTKKSSSLAVLPVSPSSCGGLQYNIVKEIGDAGGSGTGRVYSATLTSLDGNKSAIFESYSYHGMAYYY